MSSELRRPRPLPILGYTTRRHLILDLDRVTLYKARAVARKIMWEWPKVGDAVLLRSSEGDHEVRLVYNKWGRPLLIYGRDNYHLVFDNGIGYNLSCRICRVLAVIGILEKDYVKIREFRGDMTLRIGPAVLTDQIKPIPVFMEWIYNNYTTRRDGYCRHFLNVKKMGEALFLTAPEPEDKPHDTRDRSHYGPKQRTVKTDVESHNFNNH